MTMCPSRLKGPDCNSGIRGFESHRRLKQNERGKGNDSSNDKTNFIRIAADQPKLVYSECKERMSSGMNRKNVRF